MARNRFYAPFGAAAPGTARGNDESQRLRDDASNGGAANRRAEVVLEPDLWLTFATSGSGGALLLPAEP
jgi:hypothetical protein